MTSGHVTAAAERVNAAMLSLSGQPPHSALELLLKQLTAVRDSLAANANDPRRQTVGNGVRLGPWSLSKHLKDPFEEEE